MGRKGTNTGRLAGPAVACLAAAALFGAATPAAKVLLEGLGPITLAGLFYLGAAAATLPWIRRGLELRLLDRRQGARLGGAVVLGGILGPVLLLLGLDRVPAASASLALNLELPATAVLAALLFHEHLGRRVVLGGALALGAGVLLTLPGHLVLAPGLALVALACASWGLDNNLTAVIDALTPAQITFVKGAIAGAVNLALGLALEHPTLRLPTVLAALAVGALAYGASLTLYIGGAQRLGATRSQMIFAAAPFIGAGLAWAVLGEAAGILQVAAAVVMALGIAVMLTGRHGHLHTHDATVHTHGHRHDDGHHDHVHPGLPAWVWHTHAHAHEPVTHAHPHLPDLHHRHRHDLAPDRD